MMPGIHSNCIYCIQKLHYSKPYPYDTYHIVSCIPSLTLHIPIFPIINGWENAETMTNLYPIPVVSQIVSYSWYNIYIYIYIYINYAYLTPNLQYLKSYPYDISHILSYRISHYLTSNIPMIVVFFFEFQFLSVKSEKISPLNISIKYTHSIRCTLPCHPTQPRIPPPRIRSVPASAEVPVEIRSFTRQRGAVWAINGYNMVYPLVI